MLTWAHFLSIFKLMASLIDFFGEIPCGFPSPATDYIEKGLNLHDLVVKKPAATFFMRAKGDSMMGAGIFPNDILVIDRSIKPLNKHIIVAHINGEFTLKRLIYTANSQQPILQAENPNYKSRPILPEDEFQVFGVLTYNLHSHL